MISHVHWCVISSFDKFLPDSDARYFVDDDIRDGICDSVFGMPVRAYLSAVT